MWLYRGFFLLGKTISNRGTKGSLYSSHWCGELRKRKREHGCSQRAGLDGVTLHWLRGRKLAEKLHFYEAQKKSGRRYATTAVKLLTSKQNEAHIYVGIVQGPSP